MTVAFFRLQPKVSMQTARIFSNTARTVDKLAKIMNRKNSAPQNRPPAIWLKMLGRVTKISVAIDEAAVASGERLLLALLDTRSTVRSGAAFRVDGWAVVAAPQVAPSSGFCAMIGASSAAMVRSAVPAGTPQPRIAAIRREGAEVVLTVTGTTPVLDYNVAAGAAPDRLDAAGAAVRWHPWVPLY